MRRLIRHGSWAGILTVALIVGACGGDDPTATPPRSTPTLPAATPTQAQPPPTAAAPSPAAAPTATARPATSPTAAATAAPTATTAPTATRPATAAPSPTATRPPTAVPAPAGSLRVAETSLQDYVLLPEFATGVSRRYLDALYDPLVGLGLDGKLNDRSGFASRFAVSADGKSWTFTNRPGVKFHTGDPATSADFKYSIEFLMSDQSTASVKGPLKNNVVSIVNPDNATTVVTLKTSDIFFPLTTLSKAAGGVAGYLYPMKYLQEKGATFANRNPVGSGPYGFREVKLQSHVAFEARPDSHWYFGSPKFKGLEFREVPDVQSRLALLRTGAVELTEIERTGVPELRRSGFDVVEKQASNIAQVNYHQQWMPVLDGKPNPLANSKVRAALNMAVDRQTLVATFMNGLAQATIDYPITIYDPAYRLTPVPKQDLAAARQMLRDAGYPSGFEMDVVAWPAANIPEYKEIMEAIATWWESIGVKVNRVPMDFASALTAWRSHAFKKPTASGVAFGGNRPLGVAQVGSFTKASAFRATEDPAADSAAAALSAARTTDEYIRLARELQDIVTRENYQLHLFYAGYLYAVKPGIGGSTWNMGRGVFSININQLATGTSE